MRSDVTWRMLLGLVLAGLLGGLSGCVSQAELDAFRELASNNPQAQAALANDATTAAIERGADTIIPFLPAPAKAPALLGVGLLLGLARARQLKQALASIAEGIREADPEGETVEAIQQKATPAAVKVLNGVANGKVRSSSLSLGV